MQCCTVQCSAGGGGGEQYRGGGEGEGSHQPRPGALQVASLGQNDQTLLENVTRAIN